MKELFRIENLNQEEAYSEVREDSIQLGPIFYNTNLRLNSLKHSWDKLWDIILKEPRKPLKKRTLPMDIKAFLKLAYCIPYRAALRCKITVLDPDNDRNYISRETEAVPNQLRKKKSSFGTKTSSFIYSLFFRQKTSKGTIL